jgi:ATP-dependent DNA helicase RecG
MYGAGERGDLTQEELKKLLDEMKLLPSETEWVEFKEAKNTFH